MKKHLSMIMALVLAISMLSTTAVMNVYAEESTPSASTITLSAVAGTSVTSSDGHITVSGDKSSASCWRIFKDTHTLSISCDDAVSISSIKLYNWFCMYGGALEVSGADSISELTDSVFTITGITSNEIEVSETAHYEYTITLDISSAVITYTLKPQYTVTFDINGHGTAPDPQTVYQGGEVDTVEELTADGYTFGGWYKESACTNAWDFTNDKVNANTTLYAKWTSVSSKSDDSSDESKNESNTTTETETVTPQIQGVNVNGMQLNSWSDINSAMTKITSKDLSTAQAGTAASMLQINISGSTQKVIPADTINLASQASVIEYLHVFIGDGEAVTFDTNSKKVKAYKSTDFTHKDTVNNSTKTITFKTSQKIGTNVILHTTAPVKNAKYNVYYVDANGKRTLISITKSTGAGAICFPISQTGTFVMELAK